MNRLTTSLLLALIPTSVGAVLVTAAEKARSMKRQLSSKGADLIKQYEGLRLTAYQDQGGVWTIGYGHTGGVYYGQTITQSEADRLFNSDVAKFVEGVNKKTYDIDLTQNQFDALVSFAYNVGLSAFGSSTLLKKLRVNPNDSAIATEFRKWVNVNHTYNQGLANRREKEINLYYAK